MSKIFEVISSLEAGSGIGGGALHPWDVSELKSPWSQTEVPFDIPFDKGQRKSHVQAIANRVNEWSRENRVQLNANKCKELRISFAKEQRGFDPVIMEGKEVELVTSAKLLGLTIANDLTWNDHVTEITKKASKRLYFLTQLKRAGVLNKI